VPNEERFDLRWTRQLRHDSDGAPLLPPHFVLALGTGVRVVDLRAPGDATGVAGYIPGSVNLDAGQIDRLPLDQPVVLVSRTGSDAARTALRMKERGVTHVAALAGGIASWRKLGLGITRDPAGLPSAIEADRKVTASGTDLTVDRVREHVGDPRSVRWVKMASLVTEGLLSCIDGRDERGVVGTLGGSAGELLLFLAALERAQGVELDESAVRRVLVERLDNFGDFYMHTDDHALEALVADVVADPHMKNATEELESFESWIDFLRRPPAEVREPLLEHLVDPSHIGCGHIRLNLEQSEEYGVRRELIATALRAIYGLCWEGAPEIHLTSLPGGHAEAAVLLVQTEDEVWGLSHIPLISPSCGDQQMFVNHPGVSGYLRKAAVRLLGGGQGPELQAALDELAGRQLTATLGHLAKGLPIINVVFRRDGSIDVADAS